MTKKVKQNWDEESKYILEGAGEAVPTDVICDIFIDSKLTSKKEDYEISF